MPKAPIPYATVSKARIGQRRGDAETRSAEFATERKRSADEEAAVGGEPLAGEEGAVVGGEEECGLRHLLRLRPSRSEERRVGKEGRSRWAPCDSEQRYK